MSNENLNAAQDLLAALFSLTPGEPVDPEKMAHLSALQAIAQGGPDMSSDLLVRPPIAPDFAAASTGIVRVLLERADGKTGEDLVRFVYNQAIDDAANFAQDLVPHNPTQAGTLRAVGQELRHWLVLR